MNYTIYEDGSVDVVTTGLDDAQIRDGNLCLSIAACDALPLRDVLLRAHPIPQPAPNVGLDVGELVITLAEARQQIVELRNELHDLRERNRKHDAVFGVADRIGKLAAELAETKEALQRERYTVETLRDVQDKLLQQLHTAKTAALQATEAAQALNERNANLAGKLRAANNAAENAMGVVVSRMVNVLHECMNAGDNAE